MIALQDGKTYRARNGTEHRIMGPTRDYPDWCWSLTGWWFVRATGEHVSYRRILLKDGKESGEHYIEHGSRLQLVEEVSGT